MPNLLRNRVVQRLTRPLRSHLTNHSTRIARVQNGALRAELLNEFASMTASAETEFISLNARIGSLRGDAETMRRELTTISDGLASAREDLHRNVADLARARDVWNGKASTIEEISTTLRTLDCSLHLLLGPTRRLVTRLVEPTELAALYDELSFLADFDSVAVAVHQAYRLLLELEGRGIGRFAGSTSNILAKLSAIALLPPPNPEILEIGALHGIGSVGTYRQVSRLGPLPSITIIDPFAGYQMQPDRGEEPDPSRSPVTPHVISTNLALGGVPTDTYRLLEGLSTDPDIRARAADRAYGLIIIDGDHSEEVAGADLNWAADVAAPGGIVVLDDFNDRAWPGVAVALDRYLASPQARLRLVGVAATAAFLRAD